MCSGGSAGVLGQSLFTEVGEAFKLVLVDLLDDGLIHRRQHRLLAGEVLVKVVDVSLGFLCARRRQTEAELTHTVIIDLIICLWE